MINVKKIDSIIRPVLSNPKLKSYYCPHCKKMIMKGNVKRLNMMCPNCNKLINVDEKELFKAEAEET
jgi:acetyl-CoA carboxylase beta subunit